MDGYGLVSLSLWLDRNKLEKMVSSVVNGGKQSVKFPYNFSLSSLYCHYCKLTLLKAGMPSFY